MIGKKICSSSTFLGMVMKLVKSKIRTCNKKRSIDCGLFLSRLHDNLDENLNEVVFDETSISNNF